MDFPFRGGQMVCFGACDTHAANKHTGHPHPRGCGARTSHLTPGYAPCRLTACRIIATARKRVALWCMHKDCSLSEKQAIDDCGRECRHAVRMRCEWPASYSGVQKRDSVQFTFAAAVRRWTEQVAFMSAKKPLFFASLHKLLSLERENKLSLCSLTAVFFCGSKRKRNII